MAYRRTLPFVQAMEDVRFCAIQERNFMILKAICDYADPRVFNLLRSRYNQEDIHQSHVNGCTGRNWIDGRLGNNRFFHLKTDRVSEDAKGLVGLQEVSTFG